MTEAENKPQDYHKTEKLNLRVTPDQKRRFEQIGQKFNAKTGSETVIDLMDHYDQCGTAASILPEEIKEIFEKCKKKGCLAYPYFNSETQQAVCIFPYEANVPKKVKHPSIVEFKACSEAGILVRMTRKKELEEEFQDKTKTLIAQIDRGEIEHQYNIALVEKLREKDQEHYKDVAEIQRIAEISDQRHKRIEQLERKIQPMQDLLTEKGTLTSKVSEMENALVEREHKIATLETDNAYKDEMIKKLSESEILKENDALNVELVQKRKLVTNYEFEIQKLEAVREKERQTFNEVISKTMSVFREFRQFVPSDLRTCQQCINVIELEHYIKNIQKKIENFEGYLQTMASQTPIISQGE